MTKNSSSCRFSVSRINRRFFTAATSTVALYVIASASVAQAVDYTTTVKASVNPILNAGDTVTIPSGSPNTSHGIWADLGTMHVNGTTITQNASRSNGVQVDGGATLNMTGGSVTNAGGTNAVVLAAGATAFFTNVSISNNYGNYAFTMADATATITNSTISNSAGTSIFLNGTSMLNMSGSNIVNTSGSATGIFLQTVTGSGLALSGANSITMSGSNSWGMQFAGSLLSVTFNDTNILPTLNLSGTVSSTGSGGLMKVASGASVTLSGAQSSLDSAKIHYAITDGTPIAITTGGKLTFNDANTGGLDITVTGNSTLIPSTLTFTDTAKADGSLISLGADAASSMSVLDFQGITAAGLNVKSIGGTGTIKMGGRSLTVNGVEGDMSSFGGVLVGTGSIIKESPGFWQLGGNAATMSQGFSGGIQLDSGTLRFAGAGTFSTTGNLVQKSGTTLSIWANRSILQVENANIAMGTTLDVSGFTSTSSTPPTETMLITANSGGYGFGTFLAGGVAISATPTLDSFMYYTTAVRNTADFWLENIMLAWNNTAAASAHGTFNVQSYFDLDYVLADKANNGQFFAGWDGKSLTKEGSGVFTLHQENTYTGTTTVNAGTLALGIDNSIATSKQVIVKNSAKLLLGDHNQTIQNLSGDSAAATVVISTDPQFNVTLTNNIDTTFLGKIIIPTSSATSSTVIKDGTGKLTLGSPSNYTGKTWVKQGTLEAGTSNIIDTSKTVQVDGTFDARSYGQMLHNLSGATTGRIIFGVNGSSTNNLKISMDSSDGTFAGIISGTGTGHLQKMGGKTLTLTGNNTYTNATDISDGTLAIAAGGSIASSASITITKGTFDISGATNNQTTPVLNGTGGTVNLGAKNLSLSAAKGGSYAGTINGTGGSLTIDAQDGTYTLTGTNTYTGGTTISAGTVAIGSNTALGTGAITLSSGTSTLRTNGNLTLANNIVVNPTGNGIKATLNDTGNTTISGNISGNGNLEKIGNTNLKLTGNNSYNGIFNIKAGTLNIAGASGGVRGITNLASGTTLLGAGTLGGSISIASGATFRPGDNGAGNLTGTFTGKDVTLAGGAILAFTITDKDNYSRLALGGGSIDIQPGTMFKLDVSADYHGTLGDRFNLVTGLGGTAAISSFTYDPSILTFGDMKFDLMTDSGSIYLLAVTAIPEPSTYGLIFGYAILVGAVALRRRKRQ